ncbi:MAG: GNAT family N-acetyltransferase [Deltaproteobacteria bacterium]|nr:GNAT family N-acetyltransferase [Deltaproteobacteria bacterium]
MKCGKTFVELNKAIHDRTTFDCGSVELNTFLQRHALRHLKVGVSKTMILPALERLSNQKYPICSFYTVVPSSIQRETLPQNLSKSLPHYPVPVFLIAQLAVNKKVQGQQLGKITLIKALEFLWQVNQQMHAYAVVVDCINELVEKFYQKYGFQYLHKKHGKIRMFLPMKTVGQLFEDRE